MIKAIIFDFFGVICSDDYWQFIKLDEQSASEFKEYSEELNLGNVPWQEFVHKIAEATNKTIKDVNELYEAEKIDPRVTGLIHELHKTYKTALITNAHHEFIDGLLSQHNLTQLFDEVVVSSRLGIVKPDPRIFEYTLAKLGVQATETIYTDDLERHTIAASELGIRSIQYKNFEQFKHELNAILSDS